LDWTEQYGGIIRYYGLFNIPRVMVSDPELLKQILVTHQYDFVKPKELAEFIGRILGVGLLVAEVSRLFSIRHWLLSIGIQVVF
jgi:hypothetical protein